MASTHPTKIPGRWREGFALDYHTISSDFVGHDEYGHPRFKTVRTELGELLYRLKYGSDKAVIDEVVEAAANFIASWVPKEITIVPVPGSRLRIQQPVLVLAEALGKKLNLPIKPNAVRRLKPVPELKDVFDYDARARLLQGAHTVDRSVTEGQRMLLFDDLFRSGATMNAITEALYEDGKASEVYALTITRTRSIS
jgi:competence protein ComFC